MEQITWNEDGQQKTVNLPSDIDDLEISDLSNDLRTVVGSLTNNRNKIQDIANATFINVTGSTTESAISKNQYVLYSGNLYKANSNIAAGTSMASAIATSFTLIGSGGLNDVVNSINSINSTVSGHTSTINNHTAQISALDFTANKLRVLKVVLKSINTLTYTAQYSDSSDTDTNNLAVKDVTNKMICVKMELSVPKVQLSPWTIVTGNKSVEIRGTISGTTNVTMYFVDAST